MHTSNFFSSPWISGSSLTPPPPPPMPSLDVVVSVYRETGAPALYAALTAIHGRAPLPCASGVEFIYI